MCDPGKYAPRVPKVSDARRMPEIDEWTDSRAEESADVRVVTCEYGAAIGAASH